MPLQNCPALPFLFRKEFTPELHKPDSDTSILPPSHRLPCRLVSRVNACDELGIWSQTFFVFLVITLVSMMESVSPVIKFTEAGSEKSNHFKRCVKNIPERVL